MIKVKSHERVAIIGATGSGKTVLAKRLLKDQNRIIFIDPKHTLNIPGVNLSKSWRLPVFSDNFKMIVRPRRGDDERLADFFFKLFKKGRVTIYIDELSTLVDFFPMATQQLEDIVRTGREKRVAVWAAMQRPRHVPLLFLSESEVFFIFRIRSEDDRKHIEGFAGTKQVNEKLPMLNFWFIRADEDHPVLYSYDPENEKIKHLKGGDSSA
jgi:hypothetical protein